MMDIVIVPFITVYALIRRVLGIKDKPAPDVRPTEQDAIFYEPTPELPQGGWSAPPAPSD
jgi:hypothetical protein